MRKSELEKRLVEFSVSTIRISEKLSRSPAGIALSNQLARSGSSVALNYAEAQGAESKKDFIHKMGITLKELRETNICLQLVAGSGVITETNSIESIIRESDELISIFVVSIRTAKNRP